MERRALMLAYKFLAEGGTGVLSGFHWPRDEWVTVEGELWAVELDGELLEADCFVLARRGRLAARVEGWAPELAAEFARVTIERRADLPGLLDDAERWDWDPPSAAYMAAHALGLQAEGRGEDYGPAFDEERRWQGEWLAERLGLATAHRLRRPRPSRSSRSACCRRGRAVRPRGLRREPSG